MNWITVRRSPLRPPPQLRRLGERSGSRGLVVPAAALAPVLSLWLAACGGGSGIGAACSEAVACRAGLSCFTDLPGGYCTLDCASEGCPDGQTCAAVGDRSLCLRTCGSRGDCREGYQCFEGVCRVACGGDEDCGTGYRCEEGQCTPYDGAALGSPCGADEDCASRVCLLGTCAKACDRDAVCSPTETCGLNAIGDSGPSPTTHIRPACVGKRAGSGPGSACKTDADCERGACQLGVCVELCATTQDCHGSGLSCAKMVAVLDNENLAPFQGCLPKRGVLSPPVDIFLPLPSTAQSFSIFTRLDMFDFTNIVGVARLTDPGGQVLYESPKDAAALYKLPVRYVPSGSTSTMQVPISPQVTLKPGVYQFSAFALRPVGFTSQAFIKLAEGPIATGSVALNFYIPNMQGACKVVTPQNAATVLASEIEEIKQIMEGANVTVGAVTFNGANGAASTIRVSNDPAKSLPDVDNLLEKATAGQSTTPGIDIVLVRSITDQNGNSSAVLGIAGGIPSSPVLGTPHSGAVVSIHNACFQNVFAEVAAHESGHSFGLYHNVEQTGDTDPLPDTGSDPKNLMYWLENSGSTMTPQQGQVIRNNPRVQ